MPGRPVTIPLGGERMVGLVYEPASKPKGIVFFLHGLAGSQSQFEILPELLAEGGVVALAFDQRGFGGSDGEPVARLRRIEEDLHAWRHWAQEQYGRELPQALVGHSLGAAIALHYASHSHGLRALVLSHPPRTPAEELPFLKRALYPLMYGVHRRRMAKGKGPIILPTPIKPRRQAVQRAARRELQKARKRHPRVLSVGSFHLAANMNATEWAQHVHVPVLGIWSRKDRVVHWKNTLDVFDAIAGPVLRVEHKGGHAVYQDLEAERIMVHVIDFLLPHLRGSP